jgi:hypothetical protein
MKRKVLSPFLFEEQEIRYAIANKKFGAAIIHRDLPSLVVRFIPECTTNGRSTRVKFFQEAYR